MKHSYKENAMSLKAANAELILVEAALEGLEDLAAGRVLDEAELDEALSVASPASFTQP